MVITHLLLDAGGEDGDDGDDDEVTTIKKVKESSVLPNAITGELIKERGASVFR